MAFSLSQHFEPIPAVFTAFAGPDAWARDFLVRQSQFRRTPWQLDDTSVQEPFMDERWKAQVAKRIRGSDLVLLLLSENTARSEGALWEANYALDKGIPTAAMLVHRGIFIPVQPLLHGRRVSVIHWDFDEIDDLLSWALWCRRRRVSQWAFRA